MEKRILGIDIKPGTVKVVELNRTSKSNEILNISIARFDEDLIGVLAKVLHETIKKNKIRTKEAVICISGGDIQYKIVELPTIPEKELVNAIRFKLAASSQIPLENAFITYNKLTMSSQKGTHYYFVTMIDNVYLASILREIEKAGITVKDIIPSVLALTSAFDISRSTNSALVEIGKNISTIVLVKDGQIVFARELKFGSDNISKAMTGIILAGGERVEINYEKAEELKNTYGIPLDLDAYSKESGFPALEIFSMMRPQLEKLTSEIFRTFEYYNHEIGGRAEFENIYLTGGGSKLKNLTEYLAKETRLKVTGFKPSDAVSKSDIQDLLPLITLAYGATVERPTLALSLLPEELKNPFKFYVLNKINIYTILLVYIAFLMIIYGWFAMIESVQLSDYKLLESKAKRMGMDVNAKSFVINNDNQMAAAGYNPVGKTDLFVMIMNQLTRVTPSGTYFSSITYNKAGHSLMINGVILKSYGSSAVAGMVDRLKETGMFQAIDLNYLQGSSTYTIPTFDFQIRCVILPGL